MPPSVIHVLKPHDGAIAAQTHSGPYHMCGSPRAHVFEAVVVVLVDDGVDSGLATHDWDSFKPLILQPRYPT